METINPLDIVKDIQQKIPTKFRNVNRGGCAYFARYFYEEFTKLKLEVEIEIKGLKAMFGGYQHIFLVVDGKSFDAEHWLDNEMKAFRKDAIDTLDHGKLTKITPIDDMWNWNSEFGGVEARKKMQRYYGATLREKGRPLKIE